MDTPPFAGSARNGSNSAPFVEHRFTEGRRFSCQHDKRFITRNSIAWSLRVQEKARASSNGQSSHKLIKDCKINSVPLSLFHWLFLKFLSNLNFILFKFQFWRKIVIAILKPRVRASDSSLALSSKKRPLLLEHSQYRTPCSCFLPYKYSFLKTKKFSGFRSRLTSQLIRRITS